ncbi:MAG: twin-arginine translocase subunit TatC [Nitrososphaerales archaeon]|jgi:Sec-independent protein secretion pathway component TatC
MHPRPWVAESVAVATSLRTPFLAFSAVIVALLALPNPVAMLSSGGAYSPLVSLFVSGVYRVVLPPGWVIIVDGSQEPLEIYVAASVTLALLLASPLISYQLMKAIVPPTAATSSRRSRTLYSLVGCASALLAAGALFGTFFLAQDYVVSLNLPYDTVGMCCFWDSASFYFAAFRSIGVSAVAFTLPVYIYALVRFRLLGAPRSRDA